MKYCLPIIKESKEEILQIISDNPNYDFYEIWLSCIKDLDTDFVWKISNLHQGKLIFLFRKQKLEKSSLEKDLKEKIIKLIENSENLLDLDINDQKEELELIKKENLKNRLIVSYHNYDNTPNNLNEFVDHIDSRLRGNDICKVATFCKTPEDSVKLLTLLLELKKKDKKFIILGMGEQGKIVRKYGALWGNEFNFAPIDEKEKSADGQLTKMQLEKILRVIN